MTENKSAADFKQKVANHQFQGNSFSPTHSANIEKLPEEYKKMPEINGHMASHQLLIDDFCKAVYTGTMPYVNAWRAARYTIPGLIAHESALKGGIPLDIPDFGEAPEK